ncbi:nickel transport system ATP-binding protein [Paenibacillus sp. PastF-3]|uniref:ABC transporter ATP-binding protein n=1 Tax=Paenibacillus sp. PastF-3 TaxID=2940626 RepID=UPI002475B80D|nr:ABC transporter ATP-binding protein [Paenibacillus sp. PastF-3]MDH6371567.1 nickel transport system ATP-binding protein [Paenibacillus sp. PastF-3]
MSLLEIKSLSVHEADTDRCLVQDLSFTLRKNTCLAIVGESGSGKSLTAKAILGLIPPWLEVTGEVIYNKRNLLHEKGSVLRKIRGQKICMILQDAMTAFNPLDTIGKQMIETFRENLGVTKREARIIAETALHRVHMHTPKEVLKKYPHQLSGGMLQRVMISITIMLEPDIIIADEPTTALDSINQREVVEQFRLLREIMGTSILFISHDLGVVQYLADDLIVMRNGECVETGQASEIFSNPQHEYTRFLIRTRVNLAAPFQKSMEERVI